MNNTCEVDSDSCENINDVKLMQKLVVYITFIQSAEFQVTVLSQAGQSTMSEMLRRTKTARVTFITY